MPFRWLLDEGQKPEACLDSLEYGDWLEFVFDHPAAKKNSERWYCRQGADDYYYYKDSALFLRRLTRLLGEADLLLGRYTVEQIKQGFWCFITAFELPDLLDDKSADFALRAACVEAMETLYNKLFKRPGFEKIAFMYWDPLTYPFSAGEGNSEDHARMREVIFRTLRRLLGHKERVCFLGALHGLGHLRHSGTAEAVRESLELRKDLKDGDHAYALSCIQGDMDAGPGPRLE